MTQSNSHRRKQILVDPPFQLRITWRLGLILVASVFLFTRRVRKEEQRRRAREELLPRATHELQTPLVAVSVTDQAEGDWVSPNELHPPPGGTASPS